MPSLFEKDISTLKGVGPKRAALFKKLGAPTVGDLLRLYPRAYEDWRDTVPIRSTRLNEVNIIKGTVLQNSPVTAREAVDALCEGANAEPVQSIGNRFVLYRARQKDPRIVLP